MDELIDRPLTFIGGGAMASAIIHGGLVAGVLDPARVTVADPDPKKREPFDAHGLTTHEAAIDAVDALPPDGQVVLAVKPQVFPALARELGDACADRVVISILAGTRSAAIRDGLGGRVRVVRVMPNTPARIGRGTSAVALGQGAGKGDDDVALRLFSAVGPVVEQIDEELMDAFTAIAGSGPAYVFYLAEAMIRAAMDLGFTREQAERIVRGTISGSAELLMSSDETPEALRKTVTSKGGTTQAATESLDESGVMQAFMRAITAARDRGRELGG